MSAHERAKSAERPVAGAPALVSSTIDEDALNGGLTVSISIPPSAPSEIKEGALSAVSYNANELAPDTVLGQFVIRSTIASGGGGSVYVAEDRATGRPCAVKVLHPELARSPVGLARFLREISVVRLIGHPAIIDIYEAGELPDGRPYFAMELLRGADLKRLIAERGRFSPQEVLDVLTPICSALSAAHAAGVVHRDIKASNVHVVFEDGQCQVKLLDFGVAKLLTPEPNKEGLTKAGSSIGTPATMAPEQIRGESVDERTDVYALGVLIYHLLTGRLPFRAPSTQEVEFLILSSPPPPPSRLAPVSAAVDAVVLRCMGKAAGGRYPSVGAVEEAFRAAAIIGAQTSEPTTAKQAVAISVTVRAGSLDEDGDPLLDDLAAVLDMAERTLEETGLTNVLQTARSLVVARILSDDPATAKGQALAAHDQALAVARRIAARAQAHSGLSVEVRTHVAAAVVSGEGSGQEIDGPIIDVDSWPADTLVETTADGS